MKFYDGNAASIFTPASDIELRAMTSGLIAIAKAISEIFSKHIRFDFDDPIF